MYLFGSRTFCRMKKPFVRKSGVIRIENIGMSNVKL